MDFAALFPIDNTAALSMLRTMADALPRDPLPSGHYRYRCIVGRDGSAYLERWLLTERSDGGHVYLHRIVRSDEDLQLHSHPWCATSLILLGSYIEERRYNDVAGGYGVQRRRYVPGEVNVIDADTFHRLDITSSEVWTLFTTGPKVRDVWSFWDRDTLALTPCREFIAAKGLVPASL